MAGQPVPTGHAEHLRLLCDGSVFGHLDCAKGRLDGQQHLTSGCACEGVSKRGSHLAP